MYEDIPLCLRGLSAIDSYSAPAVLVLDQSVSITSTSTILLSTSRPTRKGKLSSAGQAAKD